MTPSPYHKGPSSQLFSLEQSPSFSPEEINLSLNSGATSNLRTKPFDFSQHNSYSDTVDDNNKKTGSTPSSVFKSEKNEERSREDNSRFSSSTTERLENSYIQNVQHPHHEQHSHPSQNSFKYNFDYHDTRPRDFNPSRSSNYQYHHNYANFKPHISTSNPFQNNPYRSSTQRNEYLPVTRKNFETNHPSSTSRSFFLQPIKSPSHQFFTRTGKPQENQLPIPVLPTLSPIVFSSPAPFALNRHVETKRYTDEHESPPRIIISASASVSDASGRTLNYSLGTIGAAKILAQPPASYDDYKEEDVVLDPFYHDVPKIQNQGKRAKRETLRNGSINGKSLVYAGDTSSKLKRPRRAAQQIDPSQIIKSEEEAVEVLKFLFDWYKTHERSTKPPINIPINPELISTINEQFSQRPYVSEDYEDEQTPNLRIDAYSEDKYTTSKRLQNHFENSLLQQATKGPSNNIKSNTGKVFYNVRGDTGHLNYNGELNEEKNFINNYQNTPVPPNTKSTIGGRPNRGRHRFTFPHLTTPSPDTQNRFRLENQLNDNKRRVQNPSQNDYEEFYEHHTKRTEYKTFGNIVSTDRNQNYNDSEISKDIENVDGKFAAQAISFATSQKPFIHTQFQLDETVTEDPRITTVNVTTQSNTDSIINDSTPNFNDAVIATHSTKRSTNKTPHHQKFEVTNENIQSATTQVYEASTESFSYLNSYDYTDDNYEPSTYDETIGDDIIEKNNADEVTGAIHEETNINIDFTETPDGQNYGSKQEETTVHELFFHNNTAGNETSQTEKNSIPIDDNLTSFTDVLDSLGNFQKNEQEIFNYQQNLTDIKEFKSEMISTTENGEISTINPVFTSENTSSTDLPYYQDNERQQEKNDEYNIKKAEENKIYNNIFIDSEEGYESSTKYSTETTDNYVASDKPQLYTSKPINIENISNDQINDLDDAVEFETTYEFTATKVPIIAPTYGLDLKGEKQEEPESTRKHEDVTTGTITTYKDQTENISFHTTQNSIEDKQYTTPTSKPRYKESNRGLKKISNYNRIRLENMPVSGSYNDSNSRRRNSRRKQNKPFYSQQPLTSTIPTSTTTDVDTSEISTTDISTENVINIQNYILNAFGGMASYESLPNHHSTPKGFYVTKNNAETKDSKVSKSSTDWNRGVSLIPQSTEQYARTESSSIALVEMSTPATTETQTNNYISTLGETTISGNEYENSFSTDSSVLESSTRTQTSSPTEPFSNNPSNKIEEFTDENTNPTITPSTPTVDTSTTTLDIDSVTTDKSEINQDSTTIAPTVHTFSTLNIKEIEETTNSIADIHSTEYKESTVKYNENVEKANKSEDKELTTENVTKGLYNEYHSEQVSDSVTTISNVDESSTKVEVTTLLNLEEHTTQNIENEDKNVPKTLLGNEVNNEPNREGRKYSEKTLKGQKINKQRNTGNRFSSRHRFSTANVTPKTGSRKNLYKHKFRSNPDVTQEISTNMKMKEVSEKLEESLTEIALSMNAKPTLSTSKSKNVSTPSMLYKVQLRKELVNKNFVFNCFGKTLNQFYSDPRDCRLFHYCTNGYSKNQLLDMKFVCDLGTHFDDEKLVCTREIPQRCL